MKILLITAVFYPEVSSSAQIYYDLAMGFVKKGHSVDILTSYPRTYNCSYSDTQQEIPIYEEHEGLRIHRVKHFSKRDSKILRGLEHFYLPLYYFKQYTRIQKISKSKFDVCIIYIAPLPLYYLGRAIKYYDGTLTIFNIEEFHPQELTDVGFVRNPVVITILKYIEHRLYQNADYLTVHSPGGVQYLVERGAIMERITVTFNSLDLRIVDDPLIIGNFKEKHNISNKFLVSYGGVFSPFQGLDDILDVAKLLLYESEIIFYIAGDGMMRDHLKTRIEREQISNVCLCPYLPRIEYLNLVKSSDITLVSLDRRMKSPVLPGKLATLMGMKKLIIANVDPDSETAQIINISQCGSVVTPGHTEEFAGTILKYKLNSTLAYQHGLLGRKYMEKNMSSDIVIDAYLNIIEGFKEKMSR